VLHTKRMVRFMRYSKTIWSRIHPMRQRWATLRIIRNMLRASTRSTGSNETIGRHTIGRHIILYIASWWLSGRVALFPSTPNNYNHARMPFCWTTGEPHFLSISSSLCFEGEGAECDPSNLK
jgi:hypothetical protein